MRNIASVARARRALLVVCALAASWAIIVSLTGGFHLRLSTLRVSSRTPVNGLVISLISGLAAVALSLPHWRGTLRDDWTWFKGAAAQGGPALQQRWQRLRRVRIAQAVAAVGIGLVVQQWAAARPLWLDEEMIALNVRDRAVAELAGPLWLGQSAPYGWLALERSALVAFGTGERALRLAPAMFGIATILAAFWIGRRWLSPLGATVLLLLCVVGQWVSFFSVVLKPYSGDAFWALLLPALGAWALEPAGMDRGAEIRRGALWWSAAALGHWFANGALLVTPGCAVALAVTLWRSRGRRAAALFGLSGLVWLASFGLHYFVAIRHTLNSDYLQQYWAFALPPAEAGAWERVTWLAARIEGFADNPGGTSMWPAFWLCAIVGFAVSSRRKLGVLFATVPASAFALAGLGIVPLYERLSLWVVPALYVGIALFSDAVANAARQALARRRWVTLGAVTIAAVVAAQLCVDIFLRGRSDLHIARSSGGNHQLDDRTGVRWLMRHYGPGSVLMTTHNALPALWWYGAIPVSSAGGDGSRLNSESPVLEIGHRPSGPECERNGLNHMLARHRRALVYFGFRFELSDEFDDLLLQSVGELGTVSEIARFGEKGLAAVVDLDRPRTEASIARGPVTSCIVVQPAKRW